MFCGVNGDCDGPETVVVGVTRAIFKKVCRLAWDEEEVWRTLDCVWSDSEGATEILGKL